MNLAQETKELITELVSNWDKVKSSMVLKQEDYGAGKETRIGKLWWDNTDLIFVLVTDKEEGYEGSQAQIGISKEGGIRWEYQSHCSCNDYEDSSGTGIGAEFDLTKKSYELASIPLDWEEQIRNNIKKLLTEPTT